MKIINVSPLLTVALLLGQCELYRRSTASMRARYAEDAAEAREDIRRLTKMVRTMDQHAGPTTCKVAQPSLQIIDGGWIPTLNSDTCDPKRMLAKGDGKISYHCSESGKWVQTPEK